VQWWIIDDCSVIVVEQGSGRVSLYQYSLCNVLLTRPAPGLLQSTSEVYVIEIHPGLFAVQPQEGQPAPQGAVPLSTFVLESAQFHVIF
jgi:hypothetical protein